MGASGAIEDVLCGLVEVSGDCGDLWVLMERSGGQKASVGPSGCLWRCERAFEGNRVSRIDTGSGGAGGLPGLV